MISDPGKFEGEPAFTPYFWECALEGGADEDNGSEFVFHLTDEDRTNHPDLGEAEILVLHEDANGFVYPKLYSAEEWERILAQREMAEDEDCDDEV